MALINLEPQEEKDNLKIGQISGFQMYLYTMFITMKKWRVDDIAKKMGISSDTLYRYIRGDKNFPFNRFLDFLKATGDLEYFKYLAREIGCTIIQKIKSEKFAKELAEIGRLLTETADSDFKGGEK